MSFMRTVTSRFTQTLPLIAWVVNWSGGASQTAWGVDTAWMQKAKFGLFMHYQYRILLGYSIATRPSFPDPSQMTVEEWNRLVDGFDVKGFAEQTGEAKVGWVI